MNPTPPTPKVKPTNTHSVLTLSCEGKLAMLQVKGKFMCMVLPVPEGHLPLGIVLESFNTMGISKLSIIERLAIGKVFQRYLPRMYYHNFRVNITRVELGLMAAALGDPEQKLVLVAESEDLLALLDEFTVALLNDIDTTPAPMDGGNNL
jgi:hypothetical protein